MADICYLSTNNKFGLVESEYTQTSTAVPIQVVSDFHVHLFFPQIKAYFCPASPWPAQGPYL